MVVLVLALTRTIARWMIFPGCTAYLHRATDKELSIRLRKRLERGYGRAAALSQALTNAKAPSQLRDAYAVRTSACFENSIYPAGVTDVCVSRRQTRGTWAR